jgi:DNA-binding CsgD family transcriptional regulator
VDATRLPHPGPLRARALIEASAARTDDVLGALHLFADALDQPGLSADLRAEIHLWRGAFEAAALGRTSEAIASFEAAANARPSPGLRGCAIAGALYYRWHGEPLDVPAFDHAVALAQQAPDPRIRAFPRLLRALAIGRSDLARARELLEPELREAGELGDDVEFLEQAHHLAALELHAGRFAAAGDYLDRSETIAREEGRQARHLALRASLESCLGNAEAALDYASRAEAAMLEGADAVGAQITRIAIATLELSLGNPQAAWTTLERSVRTTGAYRHPVLVREFPYAVEALVEIGSHEQAVAIAEGLEDAEPILGRWRGPALRARALARAFSDRDSALALFEAALERNQQLGSEFETARTLFARGRVLRRWRRRHAARESLEAALSRFEEMGARLWAVRVAGDLERTAAYPAVNGEVAPSDAQIARLAASGRTNREIAQTLFVSTKTVEAALSRVYRTLGVRSRAELAALRTSL